MSTQRLLIFYIMVMIGLIAWVEFVPTHFARVVERFDSYPDIKFIHVLTVTLFFANAVIGSLWELRSLLSHDLTIIRFTYKTVTFLDATFTAPLIVVSALSGIVLARMYGGVWNVGWVSFALTLFLSSGVFWLVADIPTQYRVNQLFRAIGTDETAVPRKLNRLLWVRLAINCLSLVPLTFVFYLMVHKPEIPTVGRLLERIQSQFRHIPDQAKR